MKLSMIHESEILLNNKSQGYDRSQSSPSAIHRRSLRNKARREADIYGKGGKQIDHIKPLSKGGGNSPSNLRKVNAKTNWREGNTISSKTRKGKK